MSSTLAIALMRRLVAVRIESERLWALLHATRPILPCEDLSNYVRTLRRADVIQANLRAIQP
jgi:hypothetical protein